ncbi:DUF6089 family protein [Cytophagales bacterium LB-30]|uniref:DUF6089 family protein n=1 Tax=Shiella aurantiaca TaxID=3058365 RepID=A0ABT8F2C2_9BACT|nr:DUF6089 family protein [Shiella aurantiaca]MDN4164590.1 DUF6089 family protein [Shiella aurantiaca]
MKNTRVGKHAACFPIFVLGLLLQFGHLHAQQKEVGGGLAALNYVGDLHEQYVFRDNRPAATAYFRYNFNPALSVKVGATAGRLIGVDRSTYDALSEARATRFTSTLVEAAVSAEYYFLDVVKGSFLNRFSPYFYGGAAIFYFSRPPSASPAPYSNIQPALPFGLGFKYTFSKKWTVLFETGARKLFFDYLDGISDGDVSQKNFQYGNPNDTDWYFNTNLTLSYTFYSVNCARVPAR